LFLIFTLGRFLGGGGGDGASGGGGSSYVISSAYEVSYTSGYNSLGAGSVVISYSTPIVLPTSQPSGRPSRQPSRQPTVQPSSRPSTQPTSHPSSQPSRRPSSQPTRIPSNQPSLQPTAMPTFHSYTFSFTGAVQIFVVPLHVQWIRVSVIGATAGSGPNGSPGFGARVQATLPIWTGPGTVLSIYVGGQGAPSNSLGTAIADGGWNGGGDGIGQATGGGGASDIRVDGTDMSNRIIVAGGGGGYYPGGGCSFPKGGDGGLIGSDGDNPTGGGCGSGTGGGGGTATAGGRSDPNGTPGVLGMGGHGVNVCNGGGCGSGGGGGGYYGGILFGYFLMKSFSLYCLCFFLCVYIRWWRSRRWRSWRRIILLVSICTGSQLYIGL
jgi:hypothetical protein